MSKTELVTQLYLRVGAKIILRHLKSFSRKVASVRAEVGEVSHASIIFSFKIREIAATAFYSIIYDSKDFEETFLRQNACV